MAITVLTGETLAAGIRSDFENTYRTTYDGVEKFLGRVMQIDVPQAHLTETFGYRDSLPTPGLWRRGSPIPTGGMASKSYTVTAFDYARELRWHRNDRNDNKVGDLYSDARNLGGMFARLDSMAFAEILTNSASLLPSIPNAPDGQALFYGSTRFGHASGNIVSGGGVASASAVITDFYAAVARFNAFQGTQGQPFFEPNMESASYTIFAGSANQQVFMSAFKAELFHSVLSSTGAAVSNTVLASGERVTLNFSSRISDNDWFVFREDAPVKAIASTLREPLRMAESHEQNSDTARNTGEESVQFAVRKGYVVNVPFGAIKVNN